MENVLRYYEQYREDARLETGAGALEFARTREILLRHLPAAPAVVLDVGGGPGRYAAWLAGLGYEVHLVDAVSAHVGQARARCPALASAAVGDARKLERPGESADALLLMGPLYHLTGRGDRIQALREARRVLKAGGLLAAAAINRYAPLTDGLAGGAIDDPAFASVLLRDLETGDHRPPPTGQYFTDGFFHHPNELRAEIVEAGFRLIELAGVETPVWLARNFDERWKDPARRDQLLDLARRVEREETLLGASFHLLAIARK